MIFDNHQRVLVETNAVTAAEEKWREGDPSKALALLQEQIRREPGNPRLRVFLFQLLCILGKWERALSQLQVAAELDPIALGMAAVYREAIRCELLRTRVFAGTALPLFLGEPEQWMALLMEALRLAAAGNEEQSQIVRTQAFETAPAVAGQLNGQGFAWIADADPRLGPCMEGIIDGKYYWVPFQRIQRMTVEAPTDLRDTVWLPTIIDWVSGGQSPCLVPVRYPGSELSSDPLIQLGRKTEWQSKGGDFYQGLGQRLWTTDETDCPLLEVRSVDFVLSVEDA